MRINNIKKCSVDGCEGWFHAKNLCKNHWAFFRNHGSLDKRTKYTPNTISITNNIANIHCFDSVGVKTGQLIIDIEDIELVKKYKWHIAQMGYGRTIDIKTKKNIYLHRYLLDFPKQKVDHINRNGSDNRKCNLRTVTDEQNSWNSGGKKNIRTNKYGSYVVSINKSGKTYTKTVKTLEEAEVVRVKMLHELFGEYAPI